MNREKRKARAARIRAMMADSAMSRAEATAWVDFETGDCDSVYTRPVILEPIVFVRSSVLDPSAPECRGGCEAYDFENDR